MKKFFILLTVAAVMLAAASCNFSEIDEMGALGIDINPVQLEQGMTFASYPYVGTAYESTAEIVTFSGGRVSVGFGEPELQKDRVFGDWTIDKSGKKIIFNDLAFYDQMTGERYKLIEAELGRRSDGLYVLYMGYDKGYGHAEYDPAFVYVEYVNLQPAVSPWVPENITVM